MEQFAITLILISEEITAHPKINGKITFNCSILGMYSALTKSSSKQWRTDAEVLLVSVSWTSLIEMKQVTMVLKPGAEVGHGGASGWEGLCAVLPVSAILWRLGWSFSEFNKLFCRVWEMIQMKFNTRKVMCLRQVMIIYLVILTNNIPSGINFGTGWLVFSIH